MRKKSIKFGALFLSIMMIINNFSFAKEITNENKEVEDNTMTLEEAFSYAMEHNPNVVDINKMVKDQEDALDEAKKTRQSWRNKLKSGGYAFETPIDYLDCYGHSYEMAEYTYKSFLASKGTAEMSVTYGIRNLAYSIDELENTILCLEKTVKKQEQDLKIAEIKNKLDMVTVLDVTSANITLSTTKLQLESLKTTLKSLKVNLKNLMGYDINKDLEIELPKEELIILDVENLAEVIDNSLDTNTDALSAKISYKQKEMNNLIATKTHFYVKDEIRDAKKEFSDAEARLNNSLNYIKEGLYALYSEVKTSEGNVIIKKCEYEQLELKYNQMKVMSELGMVTKHDFNSYEIALINAKNSYEVELHKNIMLNERWNIALKIGDVIGKKAS